MMAKYRIEVRGDIPRDLGQRMSAIHAAAILCMMPPGSSKEAGPIGSGGEKEVRKTPEAVGPEEKPAGINREASDAS